MLVWAVLFAVAGFLGLAAFVTVGGSFASEARADCVVVPGARVYSDGTPAPMLQARIEHAVALLKAGRAKGVIFTGGYGASGPCEAMESRRVAMALGVPADRIFIEDRSHTTCGNFFYAAEVMRAQGWTSCLVATDPFHVKRCLMICRDLGITAYPAPVFASPGYTWPRLRAWYTARECAAMVKYWLGASDL